MPHTHCTSLRQNCPKTLYHFRRSDNMANFHPHPDPLPSREREDKDVLASYVRITWFIPLTLTLSLQGRENKEVLASYVWITWPIFTLTLTLSRRGRGRIKMY